MTREQVMERARRAIPDFLKRKKSDPPPVLPINRENIKQERVNWNQLFKLAEKSWSGFRED